MNERTNEQKYLLDSTTTNLAALVVMSRSLLAPPLSPLVTALLGSCCRGSITFSRPRLFRYLLCLPTYLSCLLSRPHILFVVSPLVVLTQIAIFTWPAIKITTPI